jgi:hypothetical protein
MRGKRILTRSERGKEGRKEDSKSWRGEQVL